MADALTITASSLVGIIEVLSKTTSRLGELKQQWKQADFVFINLIAQLSALKAALKKLQEWIDTDMNEAHQLLFMDLEGSITCCRMLIDKIDSKISDLHQDTKNGLSSQGKMKLIIKNDTLEELQKMVARQTNALTLLLTACNCKAISEQKTLLEQPSSRNMVQRVKEDSSPLHGRRDSASLSRWSAGSLSRLSKLLEFDRHLLAPKAYEKRSSLDVRRPTTPRLLAAPTAQDIKRTALIDQRLEEDSKRRRRECKVFVLGDPACTQMLMNRIRISHMREFPNDERASYQGTVRNNVLDIVESLATISASQYAGLDDVAQLHATLLSKEVECWKARPRNITFEVASAVQGLWRNETLKSAIFDASDVYGLKSAPYFVKEIHRIAEKDYIPTETDILMAKTRASGIQEYKFSLGSLGVHMFSIGGHRSDMKKFIHQFENVTSVVYSVDLSCYDQVLPTDSNQNLLLESLQIFDSVVNSRWFRRTSIILLLCNAEHFSQKLSRSPMNKHFPDYSGGDNVSRASKYIVWRFNQLNRNNLSLFPHLCEASDASNIQVVFAASKDTMIFNALQDSGIPVERKNSAASTASSSGKGSSDSAFGDEKE